jgi:hypothetical protein
MDALYFPSMTFSSKEAAVKLLLFPAMLIDASQKEEWIGFDTHC